MVLESRFMIGLRRSLTRMNLIVSGLMGLLIGMVFSLGKAFYASMGMLSFADPWIWFRGLIYSCVAAMLFFLIESLWDWYQDRSSADQPHESRLTVWLRQLPGTARVALFTTIVATLWVPAFLAFYPGNYSSDGPIQVTYLLNSGVLDLHWPAVNTLLLTGMLQLGNMLFGSYNAGLSLFCILQALFLAFAVSFVANKMLMWNVPGWVIALSNAFIVLNPVVQIYAFTTAKDSLFAAFFVIVAVLLVDLVKTPAKLSNIPFLIGFAFSSLGMCLMRKQGIYVLILMLVIVLFLVKSWNRRIRVICLGLVIVVLMGACSALFNAAFRTRPDSIRETFPVPSQQIARAYMYGKLTASQRSQIAEFYKIQDFQNADTGRHRHSLDPIAKYYKANRGYLAPNADPAKASLKDEAVQRNPLGYLKMYFSVMQGNEADYVRAFLWGQIGYDYPTTLAANPWSMLSGFNGFHLMINAGGENNQISDFNQTTLFPSYLRWLISGGVRMYQGYPLLTLWVSPALPFLIFILSLLLLIKLRGHRMLLVGWFFLFLYWGTLALGPVMCVRYVIPLFYGIPLLLMLPFINKTTMPVALHAKTR